MSDPECGSLEERNELLFKHMLRSSNESDRGRVLVIASQIDYHLRELIEAFLVKDNGVKDLFEQAFAPLNSLSGKTRIAYYLGLITKSELSRIDAIRGVRNVFAHEVEADFNHKKIKGICAKSPVYDGKNSDRDAFMHMAMNTVYPLLYRVSKVSREWKRTVMSEESAFDR